VSARRKRSKDQDPRAREISKTKIQTPKKLTSQVRHDLGAPKETIASRFVVQIPNPKPQIFGPPAAIYGLYLVGITAIWL
jgi:hypothetical protein